MADKKKITEDKPAKTSGKKTVGQKKEKAATEKTAASVATAAAESMQRESGEEGFTLEDVLCTAGIEDGIIERVALRDAISRLSPRERTVIDLRYFHGLTQERVARVIGVSQVQVSRIEKKALAALRSFI